MSSKVNFGNVSYEYAKYRDEIPNVIFEQFKERNIHFVGKNVVDLGSGSGIFTRAIANQGAIVIGVEPEISLIEQSMKLDNTLGLVIQYMHSSAEEVNLSGLSIDIVTALRAWHWFDRYKVNELATSLLKNNGYLIVVHSIFVIENSWVAQETIRAIKEFIPTLKAAGSMADVTERRTGFPINWFEEWEESGLHIVDEWQHDYNLAFSIDEWCGKVRTLSWLTNEDEETKEMITNRIKEYIEKDDNPLLIPHKYSVVILQK